MEVVVGVSFINIKIFKEFMKIQKVANKDIYEILKLKYQLGDYMEAIYLKEKKRFKRKKGIFYKKFWKLSLSAKALLFLLLGKTLDTKKQKFYLKNLEIIFNNYCKFLFLKIKNFQKIISELQQTGFIYKSKDDKITLKIPYEEVYPIRKKLRWELHVNQLSKKKKLKDGIVQLVRLVAKEKSNLVGYLDGFFIKYDYGGQGEIVELFVSKEARRKGIGMKLIKEFLRICKNNKVDYVQVATSKENKKAIKFYKKSGFKRSKQIYLYWSPYKW